MGRLADIRPLAEGEEAPLSVTKLVSGAELLIPNGWLLLIKMQSLPV